MIDLNENCVLLDQNFTLADFQELTQLCFNSKSYFKNFPQVFKPQNKPYFFLFRSSQGEPICFCTLFPTYFLKDNTLLKGMCIGSVCTHPNFRNKGFASQILKQAEAKASSLKADFVYLFSEKNKLYEKSGYHLCGETSVVELNLSTQFMKQHKINKEKYPNYSIEIISDLKRIEENKLAKIWNFIVKNSHPAESILSYLEFKDIILIKNLKIYSITHNYKLCGLCFLNKGDDFKNVLHGFYYLHPNYAHLLIAEVLIKEGKNKKFYFFPGTFSEDFKTLFDYNILPTMYVKSLPEDFYSQQDIVTLVQQSKIFVRSLQGT